MDTELVRIHMEGKTAVPGVSSPDATVTAQRNHNDMNYQRLPLFT